MSGRVTVLWFICFVGVERGCQGGWRDHLEESRRRSPLLSLSLSDFPNSCGPPESCPPESLAIAAASSLNVIMSCYTRTQPTACHLLASEAKQTLPSVLPCFEIYRYHGLWAAHHTVPYSSFYLRQINGYTRVTNWRGCWRAWYRYGEHPFQNGLFLMPWA